MRVYHFVNREFGLQDLRLRRLKIATIDDLNDPFELLGPASDDPHVRRRFQVTKDQLAANRGMLCFSQYWNNPVQWSHYADRHRGLCLGFDMPDKFLIAVNYAAKRLEPNVALLDRGWSAAAHTEMLKVLSTKYSSWRYEREVRCFTKLDDRDRKTGLFFFSFSRRLALKEVIVGHSSTITRVGLGDALGNLASTVSIIKARLAFQSFKVVRQREESLW